MEEHQYTETSQPYSPPDENNHHDAPANGHQLTANGNQMMESGNIDKIRDILFGVQMRDYEKRFSRLEDRLLKESSDLREDTRKRFDGLESYVKKEFENIFQRLQNEKQTRDENVQGVRQELQNASNVLEKKLAQFDEQTDHAQRELRQQILDQSTQLSNEIRQKHDELIARIEREVAGLDHGKTDRSSLAGLFTEVALRLNNEFKIPSEV